MNHSDAPPRLGLMGRLRDLARGRRRIRPGRVAVVRLYGPISGGTRAAELVELVKELGRQKRVPAVVLDIDSPGGDAAASDYLYLALKRLADKKPLVAHVRGTGASGAYLAAMAAHQDRRGPVFDRRLDRCHIGRPAPAGVARPTRRAGRGAPGRAPQGHGRALARRHRRRARPRAAAGRRVLRPVRRPGRRRAQDRPGPGARHGHGRGLARQPGAWSWAWPTRSATWTTRSKSRRAWRAFRPKPQPVRLRRPMLARLADRFAMRLASSVADEVEARLTRDRLR
jgi:hypothetical protein